MNYTIWQDEDPESPRDWCNIGTMVCRHPRYRLGETEEEPDEKPYLALPLYLMDHSGLSMSTDAAPYRDFDTAGWDWGTVGYIYVTPGEVRKAYGVKRISRRVREAVVAALVGEVAAYDQYLRGEVYGYTIRDDEGEVVDSCGGLFGYDYATEEAERACAPYLWEVHRETGEPLDADEVRMVVAAGMTAEADWEDRGGGLYWHAPTWGGD